MGFDVEAVRREFPVLRRRLPVAGGGTRPLCYLDHGASTHAPRPVLDAVRDLHENTYANVHRAAHALSQESSALFEEAAATVLRFTGADPNAQQVVWTQNTTMALDLAAHVLGGPKATTLTTLAEHHSNELPHRARGKTLQVEVDEEGRIRLDDLEEKLQRRRVHTLALSGASNVTGLMPPVAKIARLCSETETLFLLDAAQLYAHAPIRLRPAGHPEHIHFLAAAGHKAYAPFGGAVLVGERALMDAAEPYMPGGGTVEWVTEGDVGFTTGPDRHVGGTPNVTGAVALAAATRWLARLGMDEVREHERALVERALVAFGSLAEAHGVRLLGPTAPRAAREKSGVFSFVLPRHAHGEVSALLDRHFAIATRNGCFCAQPLLNRLLGLGRRPAWIAARGRGEPVAVPGAVRATFGVFNTEAEVDLLEDAVGAIAAGDLRTSPAPALETN